MKTVDERRERWWLLQAITTKITTMVALPATREIKAEMDKVSEAKTLFKEATI